VQKTTSTHFAKQKQNSLHAKKSKVQKYITIESKHRSAKRPLELPQKKTSSPFLNGGDHRKNENP
jgi:hypothetical protein